MLGMGLGLRKFQMFRSFTQLVRDAGGVLYLDARKADGSLPLTGNSSPFVDLSGNSNDGTLNNFAGSGTSGWQDPPPVLRFDGTDDFVAFADTASLDITTAPLAIGLTFKMPVDDFAFVMSKASLNAQYGVLHRTSRTLEFISTAFDTAAQFTVDSANYVNVLFYWDGVNVTAYQNGIQKAQTAQVGALGGVNTGVLKLGERGNSSSFFGGDIATATIYTGSDINKILKAEAKISAQYLALNP